MERAFNLEIPQNLSEICHPEKMALLVYDMQNGIMSQLPKEKTERITNNIIKVLEAARKGGFRVFFCRHLSLPKEAAGVFQLRQAMLMSILLLVNLSQKCMRQLVLLMP